MKIRKLKIRDYKIFKDEEFDFTDENGKTLDSIVLSGINGTKKTTLLKLIAELLNPKARLIKKTDISNIEIEFNKSEIELIFKNYSQIFGVEGVHYQRDYLSLIKKTNILSFECDCFTEKGSGGREYFEFVKDEIPLLFDIIRVIEENFEIATFQNIENNLKNIE